MNRIFVRAALTSSAILAGTFAAALYAEASDIDQFAASAGIAPEEAAAMTLSEIAAAKFTRDGGSQDRQTIADGRAIALDPARDAQLVAAAGFAPDEAASLTLSEVAAAKFGTESDDAGQPAPAAMTMSSRGPVRVDSQIVYAAGLDPVTSQGMSLTAIAAAKFARDTWNDRY